jgi:transposase-like protein
VDNESLKIRVLGRILDGESTRTVASEFNIGKSTVARWKKEYDAKLGSDPFSKKVVQEVSTLQQAAAQNIKVSDRYAEYIDSIRAAKDRQGKWAGAITETGIRALKFANRFLAKLEKQQQFSRSEMELIRLIPSLLNSSASAIKSAGEAEDRAYSLELIAAKLDELPHQIQANNRASDPRPVAPND